jgi:polyphosphate kinase 2 (PPK2 family)
MKIETENYRVREGDDVDLDKWPTRGKPVCKSKQDYKALLNDHLTQLSELQQLHYACNRHAVLLIFQAMDAAGKDGAIRACDVRREPARLPGVQLQAPQPDQIAA